MPSLVPPLSDAPASSDQAIEQQQQNGAHKRGNPPGLLARPDEPERSSEKPAQQRAGDADQDGDDNPARVLAGHDQLGQRTDDKTEQNPLQDFHASSSAGPMLQESDHNSSDG